MQRSSSPAPILAVLRRGRWDHPAPSESRFDTRCEVDMEKQPVPEIRDQYDVIAVGSGAAGMLAAIRAHDEGLTSVVVERSPVYGGTSATSGGEFWIPGNHLMQDQDSDELVKTYLDVLSHGEVRQDFLDRYLAGGREMVRYLEKLGFTLVPHVG